LTGQFLSRSREYPATEGEPVALIVDGEGKVQQQMITVDRAIGDKWLITDGLKPGDRLIVEGCKKCGLAHQ